MNHKLLIFAAAFMGSAAISGPVNTSINGYNIKALETVFRLNLSAMRNDQQEFARLVSPGAKIRGLQSLDQGVQERLISMDSIRLMLSKCVISGVSIVVSNMVELQMNCINEPNNSVDFLLTDDDQPRIQSIAFEGGAPPPMTNIRRVTDQ